MKRWIVWAARLALAVPMVFVGCWLEEFGEWLADAAIRIEVDKPERVSLR